MSSSNGQSKFKVGDFVRGYGDWNIYRVLEVFDGLVRDGGYFSGVCCTKLKKAHNCRLGKTVFAHTTSYAKEEDPVGFSAGKTEFFPDQEATEFVLDRKAAK